MIPRITYLGKLQDQSGRLDEKSDWLRDLFSQGPDRILQLIGGPDLDVLELSGDERQNGLSSWDLRRIFYFQIQVDVVRDNASTERVWILVARKEVEAKIRGFSASFFDGGRGEVARQFLSHGDLESARKVKNWFYSFVASLRFIPHDTIHEIPQDRFDLSMVLKELSFIAQRWPFVDTEEADWCSLDEEGSSSHGQQHLWKRITRKAVGVETLPRTITVVTDQSPVSPDESHITHVYIHFNREGEGLLGQGSFNKVKLVYDVVTNTWATIRQVGALDSDRSRIATANALALRERRITSELDPQRSTPSTFVGIHRKEDGEQRVWTIHPLARCSLEQYNPETEAEKLRLAQEIVMGLRHLHEKGVVHKDVKPGNILIYPDRTVHFTDFGCAQSPGEHPIPGGTLLYLNPFLIDDAVMHDWWALGLVLWELLDVRLPRSGSSPFSTFRQYKDQLGRELHGCVLMARIHAVAGERSTSTFNTIAKNFLELRFARPPDQNSKAYLVWSLLHPKQSHMASLEEVSRQIDRLIEANGSSV